MSARTIDRLATIGLYLVAVVIMGILLWLIGYILWQGIPVLSWHFLTAPSSEISAGGGVGPQLFNSIYLVVLSMLITVPIGLGAGLYMAEYAGTGWLTETIRFCTEALASMPSIIIGLFGLLVFVNLTGWGFTLMGGALALALLNLPVMVRVSEEAIKSVPVFLKEGSLALGTTQWQTIREVLLPSALPGLVTGAILTAGRAFGEAAALIYTASVMPGRPLDPNPFRPGETLAVHIWYINSEALVSDKERIADGSAAILVIALLTFTLLARFLGRYAYKRITAA
ncbi:MAG: phosphate ABC transporter permease PstA [Chloroflexi bacterium]|nr:phosphate ABC transporter permease PstA [Chloroflexota bacterium]MCL5074385.1 phosphate ABC transporter permease PstA [Chloroflexota bacterium]